MKYVDKKGFFHYNMFANLNDLRKNFTVTSNEVWKKCSTFFRPIFCFSKYAAAFLNQQYPIFLVNIRKMRKEFIGFFIKKCINARINMLTFDY